ncbi:hypothetical protein TNCT_290421 [Trichonephila clavata]|uniref:Uncharacterized protein n=1 Tax=Trichonephila clavata TaxID=2740835 RepID=A0A8X6FSV4_TRICU|nr:hypothetical protein TNCT_290421 [Trichonephila clavata]
MWFQLALSMDGPVLGILVGMDNLLYFRILDIASLLGKKNGTMFAKCFTNDIVLGNHVLPPTQQYPKQTARVQLVTRNAALHIIGRKNKKLAKKLSNTLETGYAYVQGKRTFECSYKQSPKLVVVDCPHKNTVKVDQWIREFTQDLELQRKRDFEFLRQYIWSVSLESGMNNREEAENHILNNDRMMEETVECTIEEGGVSNAENVMEGVTNSGENVSMEGVRNSGENAIDEGEVNNAEHVSMEGVYNAEHTMEEVNNSGENVSMEGVYNAEHTMEEVNNSGENVSMELINNSQENVSMEGVNNIGGNIFVEENRMDGAESLFQMATESAFKSYLNNNPDGFELFTQIPYTIHFTRTLNRRIMIVVPDE